MIDIVEWLRNGRCEEAADEIERLRAALRPFAGIKADERTENMRLRLALGYARRFLNSREHDTDYVDAALAAQPAPSPWRPDALVTAANALIDFYNGPVQNKRPDVFQRLMQRLADAFPPQPGKEEA